MNEKDIRVLIAQATVKKPDYYDMITLSSHKDELAEHYIKFIKTIMPATKGEFEFNIAIVNSVSSGLDLSTKITHDQIILNPSFTLLYDKTKELFKDKKLLKQLKDDIKKEYNCDIELWEIDTKIAVELFSTDNGTNTTAHNLGAIIRKVCKDLNYKCLTRIQNNGTGAILTVRIYKESDM